MTVRKLFTMISLLVLMLCAVPAQVNAEDYRVYIDDQQDLLSPDEEQQLKVTMEELSAYGNVAFVSVSQYDDTGSYAKRLYSDLFGSSSGFLFVIDMGRRNIWIHCNGRIYSIINKAYANTITDNVYTYASNEEYFACARSAYEQAIILMRGGKIAQPMKYISNALIALVAALLINFVILVSQRGSLRLFNENDAKAMTIAAGVSVLSRDLVRRTRHRHHESSGGGGGGGHYSGGGHSGGGGGGGSSGGGGGGGGGGGHSF